MKQLPDSIVRMLTSGLGVSPPEAPGIWHGPGAGQYPRRGRLVPMDRKAYEYSAAEEIPSPLEGTAGPEDGPTPVWINAACPPWICPPVFAVPVDLPVVACIPWYEVATTMGCIETPRGYLLVIKDVSYEAANAAQLDVILFQILVNGQLQAEWEDIVADAVQPNPVHRMALSGHVRPLPLHIVVPTNAEVCVKATLRGQIDLAGVSPKWPGEPITTGDCHVRVLLHGWYFPAMDNVEGGIRQGMVGDVGNRLIEGGGL
jgi:hypothetical protein